MLCLLGFVEESVGIDVAVSVLEDRVPENEFRVNELRERYGDLVVPLQIEERSAMQQATGSARPIHAWPGESAHTVAAQFDEVLDFALASFAEGANRRQTRAERKAARVNRIMRGQTLDEVLDLESQEAKTAQEPASVEEQLGL
jgi:hypothetical protein